MKQYTIFAGVNGAGKTSLYNAALADSDILGSRINIDEIVRQSGDWRDGNLQIKSAKKAVAMVKQYLSDGVSFNQETTLAGKTIFNTINTAKSLGYKIVLYYVGVNSYEIAKSRVHSRVQKGGHGVADALIEKRFSASLSHLSRVITLCDSVIIYDNSGSDFKYVMTISNGKIAWKVPDLPQWLSEII